MNGFMKEGNEKSCPGDGVSYKMYKNYNHPRQKPFVPLREFWCEEIEVEDRERQKEYTCQRKPLKGQ